MAAVSAPDVLVLHAVRIRGMTDAAGIADRFALPRAVVDDLLLDDEARGWVQRVGFDDLRGWSLTEAGRAEDERRLAAELRASGTRAVVAEAHRDFVALNTEFLRAVTDWQLRRVGREATVDDHGDWRSDERVRRSLAGLHRRLEPIAARLAGALARFDGYSGRLGAALARVDRGQRAYVDGVRVDSCHAVWFELHEDLLATLGLERGADR